MTVGRKDEQEATELSQESDGVQRCTNNRHEPSQGKMASAISRQRNSDRIVASKERRVRKMRKQTSDGLFARELGHA